MRPRHWQVQAFNYECKEFLPSGGAWEFGAGDPIPCAWRRIGTCPFSKRAASAAESARQQRAASDSHNKNPLCISSPCVFCWLDKANHDIIQKEACVWLVFGCCWIHTKAETLYAISSRLKSRAKGRPAFSLMFTWPSMSFFFAHSPDEFVYAPQVLQRFFTLDFTSLNRQMVPFDVVVGAL